MKILIVDDAPSIVAAIEEILADRYLVAKAGSGEEALIVMQSFVPDLVLLDVTMTGIDGYEVCRRIRQKKEYGFVKIIIISSRTMLEERLKGYSAGADDYLGKPFKPEELLAKVQVFLRLKSVEDQLQQLNDVLNQQVRVRTEQLLNAEKMAAIGRYAAGIVHNLNTPLQVIMGDAEILSMQNPENKSIMRLRRAAAHMKKIIGTILSTGHRESNAEMSEIDLNEAIREQIELMKADHFFKYRIETRMELGNLPLFKGIYPHFSQIFGNLIKNAKEAMYAVRERILTITSESADQSITIRISDTGQGISEENMGKIFNPFFTTKPLTATDDRPTGTGLGLASVKEMVESYGGRIRVRSNPEEGTTFTLSLPVH